MAFSSQLSSSPVQLRNEWTGFDLVKIGAQGPVAYRRGDLLIISGCITTVTPTKNQAGWDLTVGFLDQRYAPSLTQDFSFLAPTSMSRYEGIFQNGTSTVLRQDGKLQIRFGKATNPMVLHMSGVCCPLRSSEGIEPTPIHIAEYRVKDWFSQMQAKSKEGQNGQNLEPDLTALKPDKESPPLLFRSGKIACLQGSLATATYGSIAQHIGTLPEAFRPRREIRCLASLLNESERVLEHSVAVTLRTDGTISVQGGKVLKPGDSRGGNMRVLQQKKKGRLTLDGIRFALAEGEPIEPSKHVSAEESEEKGDARAKISYLMSADAEPKSTAVCVRQDDVVLLEGYLSWVTSRPPNAKSPLATLPTGCWPHSRETFLTRGGSDLEERRRVDVDQYGRIFCPEGAPDGRVELTGIIFVASKNSGLKPRDPDKDELKLQYQKNDVNVVSTMFDGHEKLEQFVRRSNYHEWHFMHYDFVRHAGRKMLLPLGQATLRGHPNWDRMNLGSRDSKIWDACKGLLVEKFGITSFHTLLHVSDGMFKKIAHAVEMRNDVRSALTERRARLRQEWAAKRQPGLTFAHLQELAAEIADQMFVHWDFKTQLKDALDRPCDERPPATIEHLFPPRKNAQDHFISKRLKTPEEQAKFEEVRQFFFLYETTGSNMTHCSLMGSSDVFTTTGKWHFPDSDEVQKQLFENIGWLFPREIYLYISERQTVRFPFIEDLDIQCRVDWQGRLPKDEKPSPPDALLMTRPTRNPTTGEVEGDCGTLMRRRAQAVRMVYPNLEYLEVLVYSASGFNKGKGMLKSSFHLVWPQLIVDPDRAPVIRHVTLGVFQKETNQANSYLGHLQKRLLELHDSNNWELVFDSTTINARNGLRLPYSDKASSVIASEQDKKKVEAKQLSQTKAFKKRVREDRPSKAVGKIRFEFEQDEDGNEQISSAKWVADEKSFTVAEWIGMGTCRRDPNALPELTPWQLGPDVLEMLPWLPGEQFTWAEGEADGEGGHWVTHKPFPMIRRCDMSTTEFKDVFEEVLNDEMAALKEEGTPEDMERAMSIAGSWVSLTEKQAIWRGTAATQCETKVPDFLWGSQVGQGSRAAGQSGQRSIQRKAEVVFLQGPGKVIIDGPAEVTEVLLRAIQHRENFTKPDNNAVMPIYDIKRM